MVKTLSVVNTFFLNYFHNFQTINLCTHPQYREHGTDIMNVIKVKRDGQFNIF